MTDGNALKKIIKSANISALIYFIISAAGFWFIFSRSVSWLTWIILLASIVVLFLSLGALPEKGNARTLFNYVNEFDFSEFVKEDEIPIQVLAERLKISEERVKNSIRVFIKNGVFHGAMIKGDKLILARVQRDDFVYKEDASKIVESADAQKIDLNTASEHELAALPGVGVALAKRAIDMRENLGGFESVQDFCKHLDLMPHFAVQIDSLAFVTPTNEQSESPDNKGRVIDI